VRPIGHAVYTSASRPYGQTQKSCRGAARTGPELGTLQEEGRTSTNVGNTGMVRKVAKVHVVGEDVEQPSVAITETQRGAHSFTGSEEDFDTELHLGRGRHQRYGQSSV
jgi:hypothetical protein